MTGCTCSTSASSCSTSRSSAGRSSCGSACGRRRGRIPAGRAPGQLRGHAGASAGCSRGLRVAMVAYEDNARKINAMLAAINPAAGARDGGAREPGGDAQGARRCSTRECSWACWGIGRRAERRRRPWIFSGAPARFPLGPMRVAALLGRQVILMLGVLLRRQSVSRGVRGDRGFRGRRPAREGGRDARRRWRAMRRAWRATAGSIPTTGSTSIDYWAM